MLNASVTDAHQQDTELIIQASSVASAGDDGNIWITFARTHSQSFDNCKVVIKIVGSNPLGVMTSDIDFGQEWTTWVVLTKSECIIHVAASYDEVCVATDCVVPEITSSSNVFGQNGWKLVLLRRKAVSSGYWLSLMMHRHPSYCHCIERPR